MHKHTYGTIFNRLSDATKNRGKINNSTLSHLQKLALYKNNKELEYNISNNGTR